MTATPESWRSSLVTKYLMTREVVLQRESVKTSYGLALESFRNVIVVICAVRGSPAEKNGIQFGDEIAAINDQSVMGWNIDAVRQAIIAADRLRVSLTLRRSPFIHRINMMKAVEPPIEKVGLLLQRGRIDAVISGSLAAFYEVPAEHYVAYVNDQICIGRPDSDIGSLISTSQNEIALDIISDDVYSELMSSVEPSEIFRMMK